MLAGLALALAGTGAWSIRSARHAATTAAVDSAEAPASVAPRVRCNPEATALFEQGVEEWKTQSFRTANVTWRHAIKADPDCGPAHLRLALEVELNVLPLPEARAYYADARAHRDRMTDAEAALLDAVAPWFAAESDDTATHDRLHALAARFPDDALIAFFHGHMSYRDEEDQRAALSHTIALDPRFGPAYAVLAGQAPTLEARRGYLQRCTQMAPRHSWCRISLGNDLAAGSDCAALERFAREFVASNPGPSAPPWLVKGLVANGAPREAIGDALEQMRSADMAADIGAPQPAEYLVPMLGGDYGAAERILRSDPRRGGADFNERARWTAIIATVLDDTGRRREADELVHQTVRSARALAMRQDGSGAIDLYARAMSAGALDRAQVETALGPRSPLPEAAFAEWLTRDLRLAGTPEEAGRALASMPETRPWWWEGDSAYHLARVRALAGDLVGARQDAESLVKRCDALDWAELVPHAFLLMGEMRERTGDPAAAREAYETVIRRWGALKPKAVLADRARARLAVIPKR